MNNKMVGVVLKGCEEEPDVTRHRPMQDDWLLLPRNCIATDLACPSRKSSISAAADYPRILDADWSIQILS